MLKISEAASIAIHSMVFLAKNPDKQVSVKELGSILSASEAHLSKVLQRLAKNGLVRSIKGPKGGFVLGQKGGEVTLLNIYEAIDGPLPSKNCLFEIPVCGGENCLLGDLLKKVNRDVRDYFSSKRISELTNVSYKKEGI